jgi:hypothetical protein
VPTEDNWRSAHFRRQCSRCDDAFADGQVRGRHHSSSQATVQRVGDAVCFMEKHMNFTQTFPLNHNQTRSDAMPASGPPAEATPRPARKPAGEPPLSPSEAAQEEHEKTVEHTMPDDPVGDYA